MYKRLFFLSFSFMVVSFTFPGALRAQELDSGDVALLKSRIQELALSDYPQPDSVQKLLKSMNPDGSWDQIDYTSLAVSPWPPIEHLGSRVLPLVKAFADPRSPEYHHKELAEGIHRSLDYWLIHNFTNQNWWENDIGVPMLLTDIFLLMDTEVTYDEFLRGLNQMRGSYISQTGQNKVWRAGIQLKIGLIAYGRGRNNLIGPAQLQARPRNTSNVLLMEPLSLIRLASEVLKNELVVRNGEGIQPDWSFHQHGVQLQFGNYGLDYAFSHATWAYVLRGTPYGYPEEKISILRHYVLDGLSRVVWKKDMDVSGIGRQIFPNSQTIKGSRLLQLLHLMAEADPGHGSKYRQIMAFDQEDGPQPSFLKGNIYFWRSAFMVDRRANSYISVRMSSKTIQSTESGNGENLLGAHLSDGATYIYKSGKEYENIFPVWDWHRVPGVTGYCHKKLPAFGWEGLHNGSNFVGGVSDSLYGAAAMLFRRDSLEARKAWFFGPEGMVCLGSGITSNENDLVLTSVNQCLLDGAVVVHGGATTKMMVMGQHEQGSDIKWVYHHGIGYLFLQKEQVHAGIALQRGSWQLVHQSGSSKNVQQKVFNLWIGHGQLPQGASYAYMILPVENEKQLNSFAKNPAVKILQNTSALQAVQFTDAELSQMIFYQPGSVALGYLTVSADAACLLMVRRIHGSLKITAAIPPGYPSHVNFCMPGHYSCRNCTYNTQKGQTQVTFDLPVGGMAGQSESTILHLQ